MTLHPGARRHGNPECIDPQRVRNIVVVTDGDNVADRVRHGEPELVVPWCPGRNFEHDAPWYLVEITPVEIGIIRSDDHELRFDGAKRATQSSKRALENRDRAI